MTLARHIRESLAVPAQVVQAYLQDLTDSDLFIRPAVGMNHIAWQLGHLIVSENSQINQVSANQMPSLPPGFHEQHSRETAVLDDAKAFRSKSEYFALMNDQRSATLWLLESFNDEQLQQPSPESIRYLGATVGCVFASQSLHWMMHAGQWAVVRRLLGKPPLF